MASEKMTLSSKEDFDSFLSKNKMKKKEVPSSFPCNLSIVVIDDDISGIDGLDYEITYDASVENKHAVANKKEHEYQGFHATGDIILNSYPKNLLEIVERSIKYSNLNVVNKMVHDFGGAVTAVWILSESHFSLHEYPEHNYITVDCYTCGEEGDPLAAIHNLISSLDVKKHNVQFLKRGNFEGTKADNYKNIEQNEDVHGVNIYA